MNVSLISYGRGDVQFYALPHPLFHKGVPGYENLRSSMHICRACRTSRPSDARRRYRPCTARHDIHARGRRALRAVRSFGGRKTLERAGIDFDVIDYRAIRRHAARRNLHVGGAACIHAVLPEGVWLRRMRRRRSARLRRPPGICAILRAS